MRVGIIGTGAIANKHAEVYRNIGFELIVCTDFYEKYGRPFAEKWGCEYLATPREVCEHPDVDYVDVCTLPEYRAAPVAMCAKSGKHVLVQKPMAINLPTAQQMIYTARQAEITLGVVSQHRFDDASLFIDQALAAGRLGKLLQADAYVKWHRTNDYYNRPGKGTWVTEGGGALINQGIHQADLLAWFVGPVAAVSGQWQLGASHPIESEDVLSALVQYQNGAQGVIQASTSIWPGYTERIELHGTRGTAIITGDQLTTWDVMEDDGPAPPLAAPAASGAADAMAISLTPFERQFRDFADACATGREPMVSAVDGYRALELVVAIYQSCQSGQRVVLGG